MSRTGRPIAILLFLASWAGCIDDDYGEAPFACAESPACPPGYRCLNQVCVREGSAASDGANAERRPAELGLPPKPDLPLKDHALADQPRADAQTPVVLHQDDFSSPSSSLVGDGWGLWSQADGNLLQTSCLASWTLATAIGKSWLNVEVAAQVRVDAPCAVKPPRYYVGLVARSGALTCDLVSYYYCIVDGAGFLEVGRVGTNCAVVTSNKQPLSLPPPGVWVALSLTTVGGQLACTLTGNGPQVTVSHTDPAPLVAGSAGVTVAGFQARFDNFIVVAK